MGRKKGRDESAAISRDLDKMAAKVVQGGLPEDIYYVLRRHV